MENQVLDAMKNRSSARSYSTQPVTEDELKAIIEAGLEGPTAENLKEIFFSVVDGKNPVLAELDADKKMLRRQGEDVKNFYYEAPVLLILSVKDGLRWNMMDAGIAVENMTLAAESLGLGSLMIGSIADPMWGPRKKYYNEKLQIPEGYTFAIALAIGHKTDNKKPHTYDWEKQVATVL